MNHVFVTLWRGQISFGSPGDQQLKMPQERFGRYYGGMRVGEESCHRDHLVVSTMVACCF